MINLILFAVRRFVEMREQKKNDSKLIMKLCLDIVIDCKVVICLVHHLHRLWRMENEMVAIIQIDLHSEIQQIVQLI